MSFPKIIQEVLNKVSFDRSQALTEDQKAQVRTNIGSADDSKVVKIDSTQSLTDEQKLYARTNINAEVTGHTHSNATTSNAGFMSALDKQKLDDLVQNSGESIRYVENPSGTAGTKSVVRSLWTGSLSNVSTLYTGLTIAYKIPVAGINMGVTLNINNSGEHPILMNADTKLTTHYPVDSILILVYDADASVDLTIDGVATTFTGCWKISNYDANTTYSSMSASEATTGTATTARVISAKVLNDKIASELASLVDNAPETLNTLSELSTALGNDPNFATTVANNIGNKLDSSSANYIKDLSISGKTITFTRGDDTTDTLVTQDTNTDTKVTSVGNHYTPSANADSALTNDVSSTGTYALNTEYNVITGITLSRDAKGHVVGISTTNQKVKDTNTTYSAGTTAQLTTGTDTANRVWPAKQIADYVKGKADKAITSITRSGTTFTYTCVDGTTGTFTQQDNNTTYSNFVKSGSGAKAGLVPAPSTTAGTTKYLREDGTWQVPPDTNTTYSSKTAASGGTDVSLVTTGEKYTWNNKSNLALGTTSTTAAKGDHTHTTSLATDSGTATVTLAHNTVYKLTAGGTSVIFKTPADNNTTYTAGDVAHLTAGTSTTNKVWSSKVIADYVKDKISSISARKVGEIIASTLPISDVGLHLLDGSVIQGNGVYSDFVNYIAELENNIGYIDKPFIQPTLTANGTLGSDKFAVLANAETQSGTSPYRTYEAFDNNSSTYWRSGTATGWIEFYNPKPLKVTNLKWGYYFNYPTGGNVQGSNDGSTWTTLTTWTNSSANDFNISLSSNTNYYKYYRVNVTGVNTDVVHCGQLYITATYQEKLVFCTEEQWQNAVSTYGTCGKFVYDSTANTVRLPKITGIVEGTTDVGALGSLIEAGLPNIKGEWYTAWNQSVKGFHGLTASGAFYDSYSSTSSRPGRITAEDSSNSGTKGYPWFDASRSNAIYGKSSTVQPQTIKVLYYIVIADTVAGSAPADLTSIITRIQDFDSSYQAKIDAFDGSNYLPLSGGNLTGNLTVNGTAVSLNGHTHNYMPTNPGSIEMYPGGSAGHGGFIDFHYNNSSADYTARIINWNGYIEISPTVRSPSFQATSDIRKKSDIKPVNNLDLSNVKAYNYILKDDNKRHTGLIAQEIEGVIPDAVFEDKDGFKSLDYNAVVAVLVNKVNKLEARIKELENR